MARNTFVAADVLTAAQMNTLQQSVWSDDVRADTTTGYTLVLDDGGRQVTMNNSAPSTLTVPPNSSVAFAVGVRVQVIQLGAGAVTLTPGAGVTLSEPGNNLVLGQYQSAVLVKQATNVWIVLRSAYNVDSDQIVLSSQVFG
jgi:hypothetical protein